MIIVLFKPLKAMLLPVDLSPSLPIIIELEPDAEPEAEPEAEADSPILPM